MLGAFCLLACLLPLASGSADVPPYVSFQGELHDAVGNVVPDGSYDVTFEIWDDETSINLVHRKWAETHSAVVVVDGYVSLLIGSGDYASYGYGPLEAAVFDGGDERWLSIKVDSDPRMTPRIRLVTSPYAFRIATVDGAEGGEINGNIILNGELDATRVNTIEFSMPNGHAADYVLTSDAAGNGTWAPLPTSGIQYWRLDGNAGTSANDFLGTIDTKLLTFKVDDEIAYRIEPTIATPYGPGTVNIVGGREQNEIMVGVHGGTISGGGDYDGTTALENYVSDDFGAIGGGAGNIAGNENGDAADNPYTTVGGGHFNKARRIGCTVGGGLYNLARGDEGYSTVAGGMENRAMSEGATVGGGHANDAAGKFATVAGGRWNIASGTNSAIPGGQSNEATGLASMAAGTDAHAINDNSFVWSDGQETGFSSTHRYQFLISASNGVGINTDDCGSFDLAVDGKIGAREIVVTDADPWPDYVFDGDYDLMPLDELEKEIRQNGHLPGIPSASEVAENGISVGETQRQMMEKIEELTLYVLQLSKENKRIIDENSLLRCRIESLEVPYQEAELESVNPDNSDPMTPDVPR